MVPRVRSAVFVIKESPLLCQARIRDLKKNRKKIYHDILGQTASGNR